MPSLVYFRVPSAAPQCPKLPQQLAVGKYFQRHGRVRTAPHVIGPRLVRSRLCHFVPVQLRCSGRLGLGEPGVRAAPAPSGAGLRLRARRVLNRSRASVLNNGELRSYGLRRTPDYAVQKSRSRKCVATVCCSRSDLLEPRFWIASGLPTIRELSPSGPNRNADCGHVYG
jgi:hypothetical protein